MTQIDPERYLSSEVKEFCVKNEKSLVGNLHESWKHKKVDSKGKGYFFKGQVNTVSPFGPFVAFLHVMRNDHSCNHEGKSHNLTQPGHPPLLEHHISDFDKKISIQFIILRMVFKLLSDFEIFHMKKTQSEPQQVRRTSDPWFDINVDEVILPLDEIYQMGDMMNIPDDDFIDVEAQTERHHKAN